MKLDFYMFHLGLDPEITICVITNTYLHANLLFQYLVSGHGRFDISLGLWMIFGCPFIHEPALGVPYY